MARIGPSASSCWRGPYWPRTSDPHCRAGAKWPISREFLYCGKYLGKSHNGEGGFGRLGSDGIAGRRHSSPTTADATAAPRGGASDLPFSGQLDVSSSPFDEVTHIADRPESGG